MSITIQEPILNKIHEKYNNLNTRKQFKSRLTKLCKLIETKDINDLQNNVNQIIEKVEQLKESTQYLFLMTLKEYLKFIEIKDEHLNNIILEKDKTRKQIDNDRHKIDELNTDFTINDIL